jgi:hypothetical protein
MPLRNAVTLCGLARSDERVARLFDYYDRVWHEAAWYVPLYKLREVLEELAGSAKDAQSRFGISSAEWSWFGRTLNNYDLRHAPDATQPPSLRVPVSASDESRVTQMGADWIRAFIGTTGAALI